MNQFSDCRAYRHLVPGRKCLVAQEQAFFTHNIAQLVFFNRASLGPRKLDPIIGDEGPSLVPLVFCDFGEDFLKGTRTKA